MVKTPWFDEEVPFNMAAEVGTHKVITEPVSYTHLDVYKRQTKYSVNRREL